MFKVKYVYSACIIIETDDCRILCDPWFTDGIYDGAWYQHPKLVDPISTIGDVDFIYVSHIHPDHYDPIFLKKYFKFFGKKKIFIPNYKENNYLQKKGLFDNIELTPIDTFKYLNTRLDIFPQNNSGHDIDSALLVTFNSKSILNLNDCGKDKKQTSKIKKTIKNLNTKLMMMASSYNAAGPYPQTYYDLSNDLKLHSKDHAQIYVKKFLDFSKEFNAKIDFPFAGEYILGGKNSYLNEYRSNIDALEIKKISKKVVVLKEGLGEVDLETLKTENERTEILNKKDLYKRLDQVRRYKYAYEKQIKIPFEDINWFRIVPTCFNRAVKKLNYKKDYFYSFNIKDGDQIKTKFLININLNDPLLDFNPDNHGHCSKKRCSEITIDYRYLFGLLTSVYHWNNAEVGSQFLTRRNCKFDRKAQEFLTFFSIN